MALQQHEAQALVLAIHNMDTAQRLAVFNQLLARHEFEEDKGFILAKVASDNGVTFS